MSTTAPASVANLQTDLFINGEFVPAASGKRFETTNPATGETIGEVAEAGREDLDRAVKAARDAFESGAWATMKPRDRGRILRKAADLLFSRAEEFGRIETLDNGKPIFESAKIDMPTAADALSYFGESADKLYGDTFPARPDAMLLTLREPVGVVGAITPWNFPLLQAMWKIAPALALGNTVVLKPASLTPLTALLFADLLREAGLPPGAFNVVTGPGGVVGAAMAEHPGIDKISFTGETETGKTILRAAAGTVKRVSMELGGKSPNVVFADADLDAAAKGAINAIFYGKGELCSAGSRLLVEEAAHDELLEKVVDRAKKMVPADPLHPKTRLGALVSEKQRESVERYVESGKSEGAKLVAGGNRASVDGKGAFFEATVFDGVSPGMKIAREEIFGPVLATMTFKDEAEAVAVGNSTIYGLAAAVWTRDVKKAIRTAKALKAGTVWVNAYNFYDPGLPFGGYKESGFGRERGHYALEEYTQLKSVWIDLT
ncbi:MAG: aldehyde dehydrogenase family protein [Acidobacteriota bacterium]|nr:aldehyde dehydrogenase family protein [Acidobacteriota bacterium]MDQ5871195.1 aldehyde dehydrogenase family protein [Acidobacteriota bacterium]